MRSSPNWGLAAWAKVLGFVALIIPGIYLSLRLFWADEFALVHGKGPIESLKASWELTRNAAGGMFAFQFVLGLAQYVVIIPAALLLVGILAALSSLGLTDPEQLALLDYFVLSLFVYIVYGAMHAPELVKFYGMRAALVEPASWS